MIVAVFGTTISPYLFFWQAAQEMEDLRSIHARNGGKSLLPHSATDVARRICGVFAGTPMWAWVFPT